MENFFGKIKMSALNTGLKLMSVDEKIVRMNLETSSSNVRPIVILPAIKNSMKILVGKLENKKVHGYVYNGTLNGVEVSIIQTRMGAPNTAIIMEALKRTECKIVIRVDFCGGLTKTTEFKSEERNSINDDTQTGDQNVFNSTMIETKLDVGDLVIPRNIFLSDGTSISYLQNYENQITNNLQFKKFPLIHIVNSENSSNYNTYPSFRNSYWNVDADPELYKIVSSNHEKKFKKRDKLDVSWAIDAMYCEEQKDINTWRAYGCNSVDMETSAVYLLGALFNIRAISILAVSDLPDFEKYNMQKTNNIHPRLEQGLKDAVNFLIDILPEINRHFIT